MTDFLADIAAITKEIEDQRSKLRELSKEAFKKGFKQIFDRYPFLGAAAWTQYSPYFNDGDECVFGVHDVCIYSPGDLEQGIDSYWENGPEAHKKTEERLYAGYDKETQKTKWEHNADYDPLWQEASQACNKLVHSLDLDTMRDMLGNHVAVVVTPDGVEVDSYDHD